MDITSAIFDPEMGCTAFTVERIIYIRSREDLVRHGYLRAEGQDGMSSY